ARQAPGIPTLPLRLLGPATGDLRLLPGSFHAIPDQVQDASRLIGRVEDIQAALQRRLTVLLSLSSHRGDPGSQTLARVRRDEGQPVPVAQRPGPGRPRAVVGLVPEEPGHARGLDADQDGTAVEEDLIEATDQDQRPAPRVEELQGPARCYPGEF